MGYLGVRLSNTPLMEQEQKEIEDKIQELRLQLEALKKEIINLETELGYQKVLLDRKKEEIRRFNNAKA